MTTRSKRTEILKDIWNVWLRIMMLSQDIFGSAEKHHRRNRVVDAVKTHAYRAYYSDDVDFNVPEVEREEVTYHQYRNQNIPSVC